jgi:hypothetical protein
VCNRRLYVLIGRMYVTVNLIIFLFFYMLSVYWVICNYYVTGRSRSYPQMFNWLTVANYNKNLGVATV